MPPDERSRFDLQPVRRLSPASLRAAWWALRVARRTRRLLAAGGLDAALAPPPPPPLPAGAERAVRGVLRRLGESCLVKAVVLQAWEAAHGRRRDIVVGVTGPDRFRAHAWLDGDAPPPPDRAELELAAVGLSRRELASLAAGFNGGGEAGSPQRFHELLRRPAPR